MKPPLKSQKLSIALMALVVVMGLLFFGYVRNQPILIDLTTYEELLNSDAIEKAKIEKNEIILLAKNQEYAIVKDGVDVNALLKKCPWK